jgi:hypothetical protein
MYFDEPSNSQITGHQTVVHQPVSLDPVRQAQPILQSHLPELQALFPAYHEGFSPLEIQIH